MVMELLKDYLLLSTGAMVGLLIISLCRVAALSDQRSDAMEHAKNCQGTVERMICHADWGIDTAHELRGGCGVSYNRRESRE